MTTDNLPSLSDTARNKKLAAHVAKMADAGNPDAQFQMGMRYLYGFVDKHDSKRAYEMFEAAHESGHMLAMFFMYRMIKFGLGIGISYDGADWIFDTYGIVDKVRDLADKGNPDAMFAFGELCSSELLTDGLGDSHENVKAGLVLYQRAIGHGHTLACREAGFCRYKLGDKAGAREAFEFAVSRGDKAASIGLAFCRSFEVPRNDDLIVSLFEDAATMGNPWANYYLASVWNVAPEDNFRECARRMIPDADTGYFLYQETLASLYQNGWGVPKDENEAKRRRYYAADYEETVRYLLQGRNNG